MQYPADYTAPHPEALDFRQSGWSNGVAAPFAKCAPRCDGDHRMSDFVPSAFAVRALVIMRD
jgi:hypothetical protein